MHRLVTIALLLGLFLASYAFAEYKSDRDITLRVKAPKMVDRVVSEPVTAAGDTMFSTQEGAHDSVTDATGAEVDHYYVWVCVGDACVPVDPFTVNR